MPVQFHIFVTAGNQNNAYMDYTLILTTDIDCSVSVCGIKGDEYINTKGGEENRVTLPEGVYDVFCMERDNPGLYCSFTYHASGMEPEESWRIMLRTKRSDGRSYRRVHDLDNGLAEVEVESTGLHGYIDESGNEVIPAIYNEVGAVMGGLIHLRIGDKWGLADDSGKILADTKYDFLGTFSEGLAVARLDGKYGFIGPDGNEVIPLQYDHADSFRNGTAYAELDGESFMIDTEGRRV